MNYQLRMREVFEGVGEIFNFQIKEALFRLCENKLFVIRLLRPVSFYYDETGWFKPSEDGIKLPSIMPRGCKSFVQFPISEYAKKHEELSTIDYKL